MTEQHRSAFIDGAEPPRHSLRCDIFGIDAVNDLVELEGRKRPVDRRPRGFDGVALAAEFRRDAPADLEAGPHRWIERTDAADELAARLLLDHEGAEAVEHPVP